MSNNKRKYKEYLEPESESSIPVTTQWRLSLRDDQIEQGSQDDHAMRDSTSTVVCDDEPGEHGSGEADSDERGSGEAESDEAESDEQGLVTDAGDADEGSEEHHMASDSTSTVVCDDEPGEHESGEADSDERGSGEAESDEQGVVTDPDDADEGSEDHYMASDAEDIFGGSSDEEAEGEDHGFAGLLNDMNVPLFQGSQTSRAEALLMVLSFAMRHCLSSIAIVHLLELFNAVLDRVIFKSTKHILKKIFGGSGLQLSYHFYCTFCFSYVQLFKPDNDPISSCPTCNRDCVVKDLNNSNFFITADLSSQIRTLLEREEIATNLSYRQTRQKTQGNIDDIYDGSFYQSMTANGNPLSDENNLSYIINSDGLPVFSSSKYSLWPIYLMINELPPKMRMQNLILAGVWFGKSEPKMEMFLNKFVDEAKLLSTEGVLWSRGDRFVQSKLYALCCCVDAPARASMQNTVRFNGYFGCGLCYHPGKLVDRVVKYPIDVCDYEDRDNNDMLEDMVQSMQEGRTIRGVKGPSAFLNLEHFPISWGFPADFMHCLLLGVVRQIAELWFSAPADNPYYIGSPRILSWMDERLKAIKPPSFVARAPRGISERKYWKATEWYMWLLFYSLPCLSGILPNIYMNHWVVLVQVSFLLLQKSISPAELNRCDLLMLSFVGRMQILYGSAAMTFNVHSLTHLPKSVSMWGPLWTHSCFPFESFNWRIKQQLQGYKGIITQVMQKFLILQNLPHLVNTYSASPIPNDFCNMMLNKKKIEDRMTEQFGNVYVLGSGKIRNISPHEIDALQRSGIYVLGHNEIQEFKRLYKNGMLFYTTSYRAQSICRNNSLVLLSHQRVGELQSILVYDQQCVMLVKLMVIQEEFPFVDPDTGCNSHLRISSSFQPEFQALSANEALGNCVVMSIEENVYVGRFPNYVSLN